MNNFSNIRDLFCLEGTIIEENGQRHSVQKIIEDGDVFFKNIRPRSLVLLLCQNQYESVFFYINSIKRGLVPLLIDAQSDLFLIKALILEYNPEYIFAPSNKDAQFENYFEEIRIRNYILLKSNREIELNLHPDLALLLSTSGTTGSPKLVRLSYQNLISNASSISEYLSLDTSEIAISTLPMNYSFGLSILNSHFE